MLLTALAFKVLLKAILPVLGTLGFIPTPQDATLQIDSQKNLTATGRGTVFDFDNVGGGVTGIGVIGGAIPAADTASSGATDANVPGTGWNPGGMGQPLAIVVNVTALVGTGTYTLVVQESPDNSTWTQISPPAVTISATGVIAIPIYSNLRYLAVSLTIGGTSPSITFDSYVNPNIGR